MSLPGKATELTPSAILAIHAITTQPCLAY